MPQFGNLRVVPPGNGIVHQVNIEHFAQVVCAERDGRTLAFPDSVVRMDSHTPMVNALRVFGWGVGGIEAATAMFGQPVGLPTLRVVGWRLTGEETFDIRDLSAARQLFLDGIAVAGAQLEQAPRLLAEHFADPLAGTDGGSTASLLGLNARLGTVQAALVNGAAMHVLDFEPIWFPATHALSPARAPAIAPRKRGKA